MSEDAAREPASLLPRWLGAPPRGGDARQDELKPAEGSCVLHLGIAREEKEISGVRVINTSRGSYIIKRILMR